MSKQPSAEDHRTADHPIEPLFVRRWSPRAMKGSEMGLVVHGMQGFDSAAAREALAVPDDFGRA